MGNKKTAKKKSHKKKLRTPARPSPPPSDHVEEPPEADEEILTHEEFMERIRSIRKARAEAAGLDLPPIGQPIPTGTREGHLRRVKEDRERRVQGLEPLPRESYHPGPVFRISGQDDAPKVDKPASQESAKVSASNVEHEAPGRANANLEASDTLLNPVHSSNMADMVGEAQKDSTDANKSDLAYRSNLDFSDTDSEVIAESTVPVPEWDDLLPSLKAEIADNLLENDEWKDAAQKLGLTQKQRRTAKMWAKRYQQTLVREDREMETMRDKQRNYLLSVDHSQIEDDQAERVLAEIASKSQQKILEHPDRNLKKCKTSDLCKAWRFLKEHGLPLELAGDWSNGVEEIRPFENPRTKRVRWTDRLTTTEELPPMPMEAGPATQPSLTEKTVSLDSFSQGGSIAPPAPVRHPIENMEGHWDEWERLFTQPDENRAHLARERRLRLAHGAEGAADIMANENGPALPEPLVAQFRYNQRIELAKREAEELAAAADILPPTGQDIAEGTWEEKMEARYQKLANDCEKLFLSHDSRPDVEYEENSELDEEALDKLLEEASRFNEEYRGVAKSGSSSRPKGFDVNME
ncbi:uncharacterized protein N7473_009910 [Penicillium subrubescens]|uniref:uncharacterized protein n=1 Tax=Penicillium subrubescens TaxID=1316194 RepID=UPI002544FB43|nr:uncharacterized protein N7473_009910 [Penicillium subrubescens]KAJ5883024.1 hypothetical protein N7473_009910 [Penicillium subrubescens]